MIRKKTPKKSKVDERTILTRKQTILSEERTILSKERTILSFMQTGLAFIGAGIIIINVLADNASHIVGWALVLIGFVEVLESYRRLSRYRKKMDWLKRRLGKGWKI